MTAALVLPAPPLFHSIGPLSGTGLASLRTQLESVVAGGRKAGSPWTTGIDSLDSALSGGIPRGRITEVVGTLASGKTALLRQVATRVLRTGGWVAWIDARRTLAPAPFTALGDRLVMVRPRDGKRSAWCADLLLRSGVFSLVVIDGAPPLSRVHGVRLAQLARERDAACVVLQHERKHEARPSRVSGAVRLRLEPLARRRGEVARGFAVVVEKGVSSRNVRPIEVCSDIVMAGRVCTNSEIPDRRGVARGTRRPWAAAGGNTSDDIAQPVTWGGLGVSANDDIHTPSTRTDRNTTRPGTERTGKPQHPITPRERERERERFDRGFDRHIREHVRDWTNYRGRRRAAESSFGKPSRRERARERVGAAIDQHGQGLRHGAPRLGRDTRHDTQHSNQHKQHHKQHETRHTTTYASARSSLGRVAEGAGR